MNKLQKQVERSVDDTLLAMVLEQDKQIRKHETRAVIYGAIVGIAIIIATFLLTSCGDNAVTKGDAVERISETFCSRLNTCGLLPNSRVGECVSHSIYHICEFDESCSVELNSRERDAADECVDSLASDDHPCAFLLFGVIPSVCGEVFNAN